MKNYLIFFLTVITISAQAQDLDSLYNVFSNARGAKRIATANEIAKFAYENEYLDHLITLKNSDEESLVKAIIYNAMGNYFLSTKVNYEKSLGFFKLSLDNYEKVGNDTVINILNSDIGTIYARLGDYENAIAYYLIGTKQLCAFST
ncbi:MAG: tetratricopeptide repeat protein [Lentimicrobiaceae bacterium]|nr:tetratricopeptide repeat protein [Lentimicrobiaceae bacterium]